MSTLQLIILIVLLAASGFFVYNRKPQKNMPATGAAVNHKKPPKVPSEPPKSSTALQTMADGVSWMIGTNMTLIAGKKLDNSDPDVQYYGLDLTAEECRDHVGKVKAYTWFAHSVFPKKESKWGCYAINNTDNLTSTPLVGAMSGYKV